MSNFDKRSTPKSEWAINIRHWNGSTRLHVSRASEHFGRTGYFRRVRGARARERIFFCADRFNISLLVIFPQRSYLIHNLIRCPINTLAYVYIYLCKNMTCYLKLFLYINFLLIKE